MSRPHPGEARHEGRRYRATRVQARPAPGWPLMLWPFLRRGPCPFCGEELTLFIGAAEKHTPCGHRIRHAKGWFLDMDSPLD
jgi:hypothetical protein